MTHRTQRSGRLRVAPAYISLYPLSYRSRRRFFVAIPTAVDCIVNAVETVFTAAVHITVRRNEGQTY